MHTFKSTILMVEVSDRAGQLKELPVRLLVKDRGPAVLAALKHDTIDALITRWQHDDPFIENMIAAKPHIPAIAFVAPGCCEQEMQARSMGVSLVLNDDVDELHFRQAVRDLLKISEIETLSCIENNC